MAGEIFVWWMVILAGSGNAEVMPVPFQTQDMCEWAMEEGNANGRCIPQPAADLAQFSMLSSTEGNVCELDDGLTTR